MSKFIDAAATAHVLTVAAMEEASRFDQREADLDHLLLALTIDAGTAGQVLRGLGVTLDAAREAVSTEHDAALASLGVRVDAPATGGIRFHQTGGYDWSERALAVIRRTGENDGRSDAAAVLRTLVREPSGLIEAILSRLGTTPSAVVERLDEAERYPEHRTRQAPTPAVISGTSEAFVPATPEAVWALLADPSRIPDWEPSIGSVDEAPSAPEAGATWTVRTRAQRPDGKAIRVNPKTARQRVELVETDADRVIEWRFSYPDAPAANARRLRAELEPAAGGTQLRLFLAWERSPDRPRRLKTLGRLMRPLMRPLMRYMIWMQLTQLGGGIGRAFR